MAVAWLEKHPGIAAVFFFILVLHVCFFPFIWGNKTLLAGSRGVPSVMPSGAYYGTPDGPAIYRGNDMGASSWVMEADAPLVRYQYLREKRLPLWNPYQSYGAPLAANMQSQPFNPLYVLYTLVSGPRTYNLFILCRFLIAGFCTYLYLRLFLKLVPSLVGGIICMLSGYYILFFNMPHLSVDVLLPAVFLTIERLLRQHAVRNVLLAALVVFLVIAGGMPETTLLTLMFGYAYFVFRVVTDSELRPVAGKHLAYLAFVNVVGFALSGILLGPFVEFLRVSFDRHQVKNIGVLTGLDHDRFGLSIGTYIVPMLFGTAWSPITPTLGGYTSLRNFFGIFPFILAVIALFGRTRRRMTLFFAGSVVLVFCKRYGLPPINWIGHLPLFQMVDFKKYEEPLLTFAFAVLCALGADLILSLGLDRRRLILPLSIVFLVFIAILVTSLPAVRAAHAELQPYVWSLTGAAAILLAATLLVLTNIRKPVWLAAGLLVLLTLEMAGSYIYPVYYLMTRSAGVDTDPYRGAPYIDFLKANTPANERIFAGDRYLHPDWAGSFQLADIRGLDAMYYWKYLRFVRLFLREEIPNEPHGDLIDRFTGGNPHAFDTPLKQRLLQLSSVKYVASMHPLTAAAPVAKQIVEQNRGRLAAGREDHIALTEYTIGGEKKTLLYEHPPYDRLPFAAAITPEKQELFFSIAMNPAVYDGTQPVCGDGVEFRLEARTGDGRLTSLYNRYIDPKRNPAERRWIPGSVDLRAYVGHPIELLFSTAPGPAGDNCMDWAGWGDIHFNGAAAAPPVFRPVYDHEVKIYEYAGALPRASLYTAVETAPDDDSALARLGSPSFDVFQTALVTSKDAAAFRDLNVRERVKSAKLSSYTSQEVKIDADVEQPSLLVLNDSDYPGWKVYVDERPSRWFTTNYMFRGVLLPPGRHLVRFAYEPASFTAGASASGIGLLSLVIFIAWRRRFSRVPKPDLVH